MKGLPVVCVVLLPMIVLAQEIDSSRLQQQRELRRSVREASPSPSNAEGFTTDPDRSTGAAPVLRPDPDAPPQTSKPARSKKPEGPSKPDIEGSMVGYIDNAVVGSQVRIRFDAAFHTNAPDRAEFFYAQYAGLSLNAPGPNSVVADLNFHQLYFYVEYAPTKRFSFLTEVPVRWILPQNTVANTAGSTSPLNVTEAGLSDVAAGFKLAALASSNQYLTFQFKAYFSSGNASNGLGTNHYSVEPALLYYRRLSGRVTLEAQLGDSHPIGGSFCPQPCIADLPSPPAPSPASGGFAGDVFFYGVGPSYVLHQGEHARIAPVIELVGWRVLGGLQTICIPNMGNPCDDQQGASADDTNIVNLKVGVRTSVGRRNSFYAGFGHAVTHSRWYEEILRAEYRYSF
jgi:hypothetical protein